MWFSANIIPFLLIAASSIAFAANDNDVKIIGGFPAELNNTYHQVSIQRKSVDLVLFGSGHICGGSLINDRTVLTAAHCLVNQEGKRRVPSYFRVVGGGLDRTVADQSKVIANVSKVIIHEKYNGLTFANDIGLLILDKAIESSHQTLRVINMTTSSPCPGTVCQTTVWKITEFSVSMATVELRAVNITVQPTNLCNDTFAYDGNILDGMLCAGESAGGKDACQGKSGGPLVCCGALAGVVSFGYGCGFPDYVRIYSDVAYFREWIDKHKSGGGKMTLTMVGLVLACLVHLARVIREV